MTLTCKMDKYDGVVLLPTNWRRILQRRCLNSWFRKSQDKYHTFAAHNCNEAIAATTRQQGGIAIFAGKELWKYISGGVSDFRGLGR